MGEEQACGPSLHLGMDRPGSRPVMFGGLYASASMMSERRATLPVHELPAAAGGDFRGY